MNTTIEAKPRVDDRNWSVLTLGERIRQLEVEGYLVLPDLLDAEHIRRLKAETARLETFAVDYSVHQQVCPNIQFIGGAITDLAGHPPLLAFLRELFGHDDPDVLQLCSLGTGTSRHQSARRWPAVRFQDLRLRGELTLAGAGALTIYDLTKEVSPFRVVPRSQSDARRCQPVPALRVPPRRGDGTGPGRVGRFDQSPGLSWQLPEHRQTRPGNAGHRVSPRLGRTGRGGREVAGGSWPSSRRSCAPCSLTATLATGTSAAETSRPT